MIYLTRLNQTSFVVNSDLIEQIETSPDTVIALTTGQKLLVRETAEEVIQRIVQFRRRLLDFSSSQTAPSDEPASSPFPCREAQHQAPGYRRGV